MIPASIEHEIQNYKAQLTQFLSAKFVDQSLILGFTVSLQNKFQLWIKTDSHNFYQGSVDKPQASQLPSSEFCSIELLQHLWASFHYPIIKFYQRSHSELLQVSVRTLSSKKPQFRTVEMRKLNGQFAKYIEKVRVFYIDVLQDLAVFPNSLIPENFLAGFVSHTPENKLKQSESSTLTDFHSSISYVIFYCLLGLANLTRHAANIRLTYVRPCKSVAAYQSYKSSKAAAVCGDAQSQTLYAYPLECYSKCIGLFPTMHEPYNHIGVIYNSLGLKFSSALWFLRSQFTRDINNAAGKVNLATLFTKPWLEASYNNVVKKPRNQMNVEDANIVLLRIFADYFFPAAYNKPIYTEKVEADFVEILFSRDLQESEFESAVSDYLTVFVCFYSLAEKEDRAVRENVGTFFARFIAYYLHSLTGANRNLDTALGNVRLILALLRKNGPFLKKHGARLVDPLAKALNSLLNSVDEDSKDQITIFCSSEKEPMRAHYFEEDVRFKDFTPIGCQFKDFNDNHLFQSGRVHLLFGADNAADNEIPAYLDNDAVNRINKTRELNSQQPQDAVWDECRRYENISRLKALVHLFFKLFSSCVTLSEEDLIIVKKSEVEKKEGQRDNAQAKSRKKNKTKVKEQKPDPATQRPEPATQTPEATAPASFKDIESMILGHASKLNKQTEEKNDRSFAEMVDSIVSDDDTSHDILQVQSTMDPGAPKAPPSLKKMHRPQSSHDDSGSQANSQYNAYQAPVYSQASQGSGQYSTPQPSQAHLAQTQVAAETPSSQAAIPAQVYPVPAQFAQYQQNMYMAPGWFGGLHPAPPGTFEGMHYGHTFPNGQKFGQVPGPMMYIPNMPPQNMPPQNVPSHSMPGQNTPNRPHVMPQNMAQNMGANIPGASSVPHLARPEFGPGPPTGDAQPNGDASHLGNYMYPQYYSQ